MDNWKNVFAFVFMLSVALFGIGIVLYDKTVAPKAISYWATFENGATKQVDNVIVVPILSVEQIDRMWPEYYAETKIIVEGKEITLQSRPFLFCDNPEIEGNYAGRNVYCPLAERNKQ